jgi:hypothetical protein
MKAGVTIETKIKEFLQDLAKSNGEADRLSAAKLIALKRDLENGLKRVSKVADLEIVISIDDLDEFDGEAAV